MWAVATPDTEQAKLVCLRLPPSDVSGNTGNQISMPNLKRPVHFLVKKNVLSYHWGVTIMCTILNWFFTQSHAVGIAAHFTDGKMGSER